MALVGMVDQSAISDCRPRIAPGMTNGIGMAPVML